MLGLSVGVNYYRYVVLILPKGTVDYRHILILKSSTSAHCTHCTHAIMS